MGISLAEHGQTAAWGLSLIGHWCAVYLSYEDKGHEDYKRQEANG